MPVLCGNFLLKNADRNKMQYAVKMCGIMPRSRIRIKPAYGNGESDTLCRKICDIHTCEKYASNAAIAYLHKTDMRKQQQQMKLSEGSTNWLPLILAPVVKGRLLFNLHTS